MSKEAPPHQKADIASMKQVAIQLGIAWDDVLESAGLSRSSAWRIENRQVSKNLRNRIWEVLDEERRRRAIASGSPPGHERWNDGFVDRIKRWDEIGRVLVVGETRMFDRLLEMLGRMAEAQRASSAEYHEIIDHVGSVQDSPDRGHDARPTNSETGPAHGPPTDPEPTRHLVEAIRELISAIRDKS